MRVHMFHLFAKGLKHTRMTNITEWMAQNASSWTTLLSISTPTKAIEAHCQTERVDKYRATKNIKRHSR